MDNTVADMVIAFLVVLGWSYVVWVLTKDYVYDCWKSFKNRNDKGEMSI